jgi:hypothetical protein
VQGGKVKIRSRQTLLLNIKPWFYNRYQCRGSRDPDQEFGVDICTLSKTSVFESGHDGTTCRNIRCHKSRSMYYRIDTVKHEMIRPSESTEHQSPTPDIPSMTLR